MMGLSPTVLSDIKNTVDKNKREQSSLPFCASTPSSYHHDVGQKKRVLLYRENAVPGADRGFSS